MKSNIKKIEVCCNNCGSSESHVITTGHEHEYTNTTDDEFTVVGCRNCGLAYLNPRPDVSELNTIYPSNYYAYSLEEGYSQAQRASFYYKLRYATILKGLERALCLIDNSEPIKLLDIGCADGHVLNWFAQVKSHQIETHGIDMNAQATGKAAAQGHIVYTGRFEDVEFAPDSFDFIWASHVIEHVADPKAFTQKAFEILKPGGIFWFWTPNIDSIEAGWFRNKHWGAYHFPRHWVFYNKKSIGHLAKCTGFELAHIEFQPNAIFWVWTFHSLLKSNRLLSKYADCLFPPVDWSKTTGANFMRNGFFTLVDLVIKTFTGQTSNMGVAFRKPLN